jgi:hypothetical protein
MNGFAPLTFARKFPGREESPPTNAFAEPPHCSLSQIARPPALPRSSCENPRHSSHDSKEVDRMHPRDESSIRVSRLTLALAALASASLTISPAARAGGPIPPASRAAHLRVASSTSVLPHLSLATTSTTPRSKSAPAPLPTAIQSVWTTSQPIALGASGSTITSAQFTTGTWHVIIAGYAYASAGSTGWNVECELVSGTATLGTTYFSLDPPAAPDASFSMVDSLEFSQAGSLALDCNMGSNGPDTIAVQANLLAERVD